MTEPTHPASGQDATRYVLRLAARLHPRWATRFDGMTLRQLDDGTTVLEGEVPDQAALHGVLHGLRDLGVPLLSLTRLDPTPTDPPDPTTPTGDRS